MKEDTGDLWDYPADAVVITTNGYVRKDGKCVMGRGCAKEADRKYDMADDLGWLISLRGNHVYSFDMAYPGEKPNIVLTFPVKHNWWEKADPQLIERSAQELVEWADTWGKDIGIETYVVPRPGCGNGGLDWEDVKPILEPILDDRFTVITYG